MTRTTLIRSDIEVGDGSAQPFLEADTRPVPEHATGERNVGPRVTHIARPRLGVALLDGTVEDLSDRVREVVDACGRARRDVEDLSACAVGLARTDRRIDDVPDIREVARLLTVAEDRHRPVLGDRSHEQRDHRGVLRERALAFAEDVEVAEDDRLETVIDAAEADAVALGS